MQIFFNWIEKNESPGWWQLTIKILFVSQGIYLPLLRLIEPVFFVVVKRNFKSCVDFVCCRTVKEVEFVNEQSIDTKVFLDTEDDEDAKMKPVNCSQKLVSHGLTDDISKVKVHDSTEITGDKSEKELTPMYLFLASSLNVELVYSILKGITQFGYITLANPEQSKGKLAKMRIETGRDSTSLTLFEIKIKNTKDWSSASYQQFMQNDLMQQPIAASADKEDLLTLKQKVKVTFHMIEHFKELYALWGVNNFDDFYESLSPKNNRDMIFKAGEGAGRSGSFFFFSHDHKFVVKTMTSGELALMKRIMP